MNFDFISIMGNSHQIDFRENYDKLAIDKKEAVYSFIKMRGGKVGTLAAELVKCLSTDTFGDKSDAFKRLLAVNNILMTSSRLRWKTLKAMLESKVKKMNRTKTFKLKHKLRG